MPKEAKTFTIDDWIADVIPADKLGDENVKKAVLGIIKDPAVVDKIQAGTMLRSEFSRRMNDWEAEKKAEEERLALAKSKYEEELARLSNWEQQGEALIAEHKTAAQKAAEQAAQAQAALRRLQREYEIPDDDLGVKIEEKPVSTQPQFDPSELKKEILAMVQKNNKEVAQVMTKFPVQLTGLLRRHQEVFGAGEIPDVEALFDQFTKTGKPIDQLWQETYKVTDKLAEKAEAQIQQRIKEAEERAEKRAIERMNTPLTTFDPTGAKSPALRAHGIDGMGLKPEEKKTGVQRAMERYEQNRMAEAKAARDRAGAAA